MGMCWGGTVPMATFWGRPDAHPTHAQPGAGPTCRFLSISLLVSKSSSSSPKGLMICSATCGRGQVAGGRGQGHLHGTPKCHQPRCVRCHARDWGPPGHPPPVPHLQPAGVEEELQQGGKGHVHVQIPLLPRLQRLQELPPDEAEGEEGVHGDGDHLRGQRGGT